MVGAFSRHVLISYDRGNGYRLVGTLQVDVTFTPENFQQFITADIRVEPIFANSTMIGELRMIFLAGEMLVKGGDEAAALALIDARVRALEGDFKAEWQTDAETAHAA